MKKLLYCALAALALTATGCSKDDDKDSETTASAYGTWCYHTEDSPETMVLNEDGNYSLTMELYKEEGTFTYTTNALTLTATQAWRRDWVREEVHGGPIVDENGNYQYTEWEAAEMPQPVTYPAKLIYDGDVLMLQQSSYDEQAVWAPYVRKEATRVSNMNDIQGKWYWNSVFGDQTMRRVIVNVDGDKGEVIITPWGERYTGTIRYEKGIIYMDNPTFTTTRYDDGTDEWEHMNEEDPENSDWRTPFGENAYQGTYGSLAFTFVADGNTAYGGIANLLAPFEKQ